MLEGKDLTVKMYENKAIEAEDANGYPHKKDVEIN